MGTLAAELKKLEDTVKRKTLEDLFNEPCTILMSRAMMHQAFEIPGGGTESSLSAQRTSGLKIVYHPGYGMIGCLKGRYFLSPSANVIVSQE